MVIVEDGEPCQGACTGRGHVESYCSGSAVDRIAQRELGGDADAHTRSVVARVQADGTAWLAATTWHGMAAMRISVSNWSTTDADADLTVDNILRCAAPA
jgi:hypothetical protein